MTQCGGRGSGALEFGPQISRGPSIAPRARASSRPRAAPAQVVEPGPGLRRAEFGPQIVAPRAASRLRSLLAPLRAQVVEPGPGHERFAEYVVFHGDRLYPEYLVAYTRL